ncbi:cysteine--tRNA ligase [Gammaproteobacteria bacterium]|nr:cysteine--tRNA ligase [Gammaproteobacteria bacterium]
MVLQLYNTLARDKRKFEPLDANSVGMYVCGPTVYDYAHIGNARPVIVFDLLFRLLREMYGEEHVTYVRNITDVDDKIIAAHQESGEDISSITSRTTDAFHSDMAALGNLTPTVEPRATDHTPQMIKLIEKLIADGHAYENNGHVCFHVPSMKDYGRLARLNREELIAGARVEIAPYKKDASDFILWKPSEDNQPGWESPWGRGRPGWHIECSAMSAEYLGESFDIHGGGQDLIFPHHENEIAQSCCAQGRNTFAQTWMHNGYLMVEGEKMSKSRGNFITVKELRDIYHGETIRYCMLMTQYRQPLNWTEDGLSQAKTNLDSFYGALRTTSHIKSEMVPAPDNFIAALSDDLNTPQAIVVLHELLGLLNKATSDSSLVSARSHLLAAGRIMGLLQINPEAWFKWSPVSLIESVTDTEIESMIESRKIARENKDFDLSDKIRQELADQGIMLEDSNNRTTWKRV